MNNRHHISDAAPLYGKFVTQTKTHYGIQVEWTQEALDCYLNANAMFDEVFVNSFLSCVSYLLAYDGAGASHICIIPHMNHQGAPLPDGLLEGVDTVLALMFEDSEDSQGWGVLQIDFKDDGVNVCVYDTVMPPLLPPRKRSAKRLKQTTNRRFANSIEAVLMQTRVRRDGRAQVVDKQILGAHKNAPDLGPFALKELLRQVSYALAGSKKTRATSLLREGLVEVHHPEVDPVRFGILSLFVQMMNFATVRMNVGKDKVDVQNWSIKMDLAMSLYRRPYAAGPAQCFFCQKLLSKRPTSRITAFCCCPVRVHHQCWLEKIRKVAGVLMGGMQEE